MSWCISQDQKIGFSGSAFVGLCAHSWMHTGTLSAITQWTYMLLTVSLPPGLWRLPLQTSFCWWWEDGRPFIPSICTGRWPPLHTLRLHGKVAAPSHPLPAREGDRPFTPSSCPCTPPASRIWIALLERKALLPTNPQNKMSQELTDS